MFFGLKNIDDHPCFKMQDIVNALLWAVVTNKPFEEKMFPSWFKTTYKRATTVIEELSVIHTALLDEDIELRQLIYSQFINNNAIEIICDDASYGIEDYLDWEVQPDKNIKALIIMLYAKLDLAVFKRKKCKLKPLHRYYSDFIKENSYVCPFCFINPYKNRLSPKREDLDHYFCKSFYPLAAANMKNLVPMCSDCNQTYKRETKIAEHDGVRVAAFYPFSEIPEIELIIGCDRYPSSVNVNDNGMWSVDLICSDPTQQVKVENWDRVFDIRKRISNEIAEYHQTWIQRSLRRHRPDVFENLAAFRGFLQQISSDEYEESNHRMEPKTIIKAALFYFLADAGEDIFLRSFMYQYQVEKAIAA